MKKKSDKSNQVNKLDIARWIAVLPVTLVALSIYTTVMLNFIYKLLNLLTDEERVAQIIGLSDGIILPAIIISCGYYISPKFKFRSTLILVLFFLGIQMLHMFEPSEFTKFSPRIFLWIFSYIVGLFIVFKHESNK